MLLTYPVKISGGNFGTSVTQTIESGRPIYVHGMIFSNGSGAIRTLTLKSGDGSTTYVNLTWPTAVAGRNILFRNPFYAAQGLQLVVDTTGATLSFTVFHSQAGA